MYHLPQRIIIASLITVFSILGAAGYAEHMETGITSVSTNSGYREIRSDESLFSKIDGIPTANTQNGMSGIQLASHPQYKNVTYQDAFDQFFFCPVWSDMRFTGYCNYYGNLTKIEIEFSINPNDQTFTYAGFFVDGNREEIVLLEQLADTAFRQWDSNKLQESKTGLEIKDDSSSGNGKEWRAAYCSFLEAYRGLEDKSASMIYLDEDDLPELLLVDRLYGIQLMTYKDGQIKQINFPDILNTPSWFHYIHKTGKIWVRRPVQATEDDMILQYQNGEMTILQRGYTGTVGIFETDVRYVWEEKWLRTESEYWKAIHEVFDFSQAWQNYEISCEEMYQLLNY